MANYTIDISFKCDRCGAVAHHVFEARHVYAGSTFRYDVHTNTEAPKIEQPFFVNDDYGRIMLCRSCKKEYDNIVDMSKKVQNTMIDSFFSGSEKSDRED